MQASSVVIQSIPAILMAVLLLAGIIVMAANRPNHGHAAVLGMVGCVLLVIGLVSSTLFAYYLPWLARSSGLSISAVVMVWRLISFLFEAAGTGLLIWAVVAKRRPPQGASPQGPGWQQQPWPPNQG